ncbi:MAG: type II toxin-antitoxin system VapC family toxin [Actinomycetota bacterium]|nr:type II toxin-antitoxin system VapC family toxin [Actinomycetota bacterium]
MGLRVLLDTHALLWALMEPERLSTTARGIIVDPSSVLLVSSASAWEIATKYRLGRLDAAEAVVHGFRAHLGRLGAEELPIRADHAILAGSLQGPHRDPFDRVLTAQSLIEAIPVVTGDRDIADLGAPTVW